MRLRIMGTQTTVANLHTNRFSALEEIRDTVATVSDELSDTEPNVSDQKSKLAEVEINWPKSNRWFFLSFFFSLFFTFFLFLLISLFILFLFCFCFRPQKLELNPKPRTSHPISDGPFRWTPLR